MREYLRLEPVDYLIIGHLTQDLTPNGPKLGGTAAYAALTAHACGLRVGVVTACSPDLEFPELNGIAVSAVSSEFNTTFENIQTPEGRVQYLHHQAETLDFSMVPDIWRTTPIVHLGPVDRELDPRLARSFPNATVCLTPQGWLRAWNEKGKVHYGDWPESAFVLEQASMAVLSMEDVRGNEALIEEFLASIRLLVVTEGAAGCRLYWNGDLRYFRPPQVQEIDPTGAGDIFATAFFIRYQTTHDPWEAARFATQLAATSVTRRGLLGVPTESEVLDCITEILPKR